MNFPDDGHRQNGHHLGRLLSLPHRPVEVQQKVFLYGVSLMLDLVALVDSLGVAALGESSALML